MDLLVAIAVGICGGILGVVPFVVAHSRSKKHLKRKGFGGISFAFAAVFVSLFILAAEVIMCRLLAADYLLPFSISAIVTFLVLMMFYTARLMRR